MAKKSSKTRIKHTPAGSQLLARDWPPQEWGHKLGEEVLKALDAVKAELMTIAANTAAIAANTGQRRLPVPEASRPPLAGNYPRKDGDTYG